VIIMELHVKALLIDADRWKIEANMKLDIVVWTFKPKADCRVNRSLDHALSLVLEVGTL
jgi:hypothetical protein